MYTVVEYYEQVEFIYLKFIKLLNYLQILLSNKVIYYTREREI